MGDQNYSGKKGWYMHTSYNEAQQLKARVKAEIAKHHNDDDLSAILAKVATSGDDQAKRIASSKKANRQLYGILVGQIALEDLISYLGSNHDDKGVEALSYITACHGAGTDDNKLYTTRPTKNTRPSSAKASKTVRRSRRRTPSSPS